MKDRFFYFIYIQMLKNTSKYTYINYIPYLNGVKKVLDYGCGDGSLSNYFITNDNKVYVFDVSYKMLSYVKRKYPKLNIIFNERNLLNKYFDIIFITSVIQYIPEKKLEDLLKFLKSRSKKIVISDIPERKSCNEALLCIKKSISLGNIKLIILLLCFYLYKLLFPSDHKLYYHNDIFFKNFAKKNDIKISKINNLGFTDSRSTYILENE